MNVVVGLEGDFSLIDLEKFGFNGGLIFKFSFDWNVNVCGCLGYVFDCYFVYGVGGLVFVDLEVVGNGDKDSKIVVGWMFGVGVEVVVINNVMVCFEYVY